MRWGAGAGLYSECGDHLAVKYMYIDVDGKLFLTIFQFILSRNSLQIFDIVATFLWH